MSWLQIFRKPHISNLSFQQVGPAVGNFTQLSAEIEGWGRLYVTTSFQPKRPDYSEASILLWEKFRATLRQVKAFLTLGHHEFTLDVPQGSTIKVVTYNLFGHTSVSCSVPITSTGSFSAAMPTDINAKVEAIAPTYESIQVVTGMFSRAENNFSRQMTASFSQIGLSTKAVVPSIRTKTSSSQSNINALAPSKYITAQDFHIKSISISKQKKEFMT